MAKIINANNLTKIYGEKETSVTALDDINIEFRENEFTAIWFRKVYTTTLPRRSRQTHIRKNIFERK